MSLIIKAYAKINLSFEILGKLPNGYHEIKSVFQAVDIYDVISITKTGKEFELTGSIICPSGENLITKAKEELENFLNRDFLVKYNF